MRREREVHECLQGGGLTGGKGEVWVLVIVGRDVSAGMGRVRRCFEEGKGLCL